MDENNKKDIINVKETSGKEHGLSISELDTSCTIIKDTGIYNTSIPKYKNINSLIAGPLGTILSHNLTDNNYAICTTDTTNDAKTLQSAISAQSLLVNNIYDKINDSTVGISDISTSKNTEEDSSFVGGRKPSFSDAHPEILPSDYNINLSGVSDIYAKNTDNKWYISAVKTLPQNCISTVNPDTNRSEGHCFDINNNSLLQKFIYNADTGLYWKEYNFDTALKVLKNQNDINPDVCVITTPNCDITNLKTFNIPLPTSKSNAGNLSSFNMETRCKAICFSKQVNANSEISYPMTYNNNSNTWEWE